MKPVLLAACAATALAACSPRAPKTAEAPAAPAAAPASVAGLPAGLYVTDPSHSSLIFRVSHMGFSNFTGRFVDVKANLRLDPADPKAASLEATIDPATLASDNPPKGFNELIRGPEFLDAPRFPKITYRSTAIEMTGPDTAKVTGDLTLHGVTKPVVLDVKFNGGYPGFQMDPQARIGFSAKGTLKRSDFGIAYGIPAPGSNMGVFDPVDFQIETEMTGPAWKAPAD